MIELSVPPLLGLFGTGIVLHFFWERWRRWRRLAAIARWVIENPTDVEIDNLLRDPEHAAALLGELRQQILARPTGEV